MINKKSATFSLLIFIQLLLNGYGERTKDKMYEKVTGSPCYRRLNATHQVGCSSKKGGSTGVVHYCDTVNDLEFILQNGTAGHYVPVIPTRLFTLENFNKMNSSGKVSGLIVHTNNNETIEYFTHENQCPNDRYNLEGTCSKNNVWNPKGTGLLYTDIPFPVFFMSNYEDVLKIKACFQKFNNFSYESQSDRSLCGLELDSFMTAATNTPVCQRRSNLITNLNPVKFCDPLGDSNIWGSLFPLVTGPKNNTKPILDFQYIIVAARMDTTSLFDDGAGSGAISPITGIVTLLSVAKLLKTMLPNNTNGFKTNVLFVLFNGETYDYIGSSRFLYDMEKGSFPIHPSEDNNYLPVIRPENISLFVELSQLSMKEGGLVYVHALKGSFEINSFYNKLKYNGNATVKDLLTSNVPPTSLQTFLKENTDFPGLVLTDHESSYVNHFYNSLYDNSMNLGYHYSNVSDIPEDAVQRHTVDVATIVAKSLYNEITGQNYSGSATLDVVLVDELFHCYLESMNCRVHNATSVSKTKYPHTPASLYVGVDRVSNFVTSLTTLTLAWFLGDTVGESNINCTNKPKNHAFKYFNMSESIYNLNSTSCYRATVGTTEAISPAFIIKDYDWASGKYSSWAESTWDNTMRLQLFLKPSRSHENMTISVGTIVLILSFILVYFVHSRSHILFPPVRAVQTRADC